MAPSAPLWSCNPGLLPLPHTYIKAVIIIKSCWASVVNLFLLLFHNDHCALSPLTHTERCIKVFEWLNKRTILRASSPPLYFLSMFHWATGVTFVTFRFNHFTSSFEVSPNVCQLPKRIFQILGHDTTGAPPSFLGAACSLPCTV